LGEQLLLEGIPVVVLNRQPGRDWGVAWRLAREIRTRSIEVVHAHQYSPFFYATLAKFATGGRFRLILTEHGRHYPDDVSPMRRGLNRVVLDRLADAVNACCAFSAKALSRNDGFRGKRIEIIENGIDVDRYDAMADRGSLRARLGLDDSRRYVAMIARFHPAKDHATLLRAFARVADHRPDVDLVLAGDGQLRGEIEEQVSSLGLTQRIRLLGVRRDVPEILQAVDIFALSSVCEAASLTLLEAMAAGRPVVVTAVGGNPEIVRQGIDGLLTPRGDDAALAKSILRLLDDPDEAKRMGASGQKRVRDRYRLETTVDRYYNLYRRLVKRGGDVAVVAAGALVA
jgi:glycosyltransferase involved in cell wall biosynthesis